jgi:hypothetical protein
MPIVRGLIGSIDSDLPLGGIVPAVVSLRLLPGPFGADLPVVQLPLPDLFFLDFLFVLPERVPEPYNCIVRVLFWLILRKRQLQVVPTLLLGAVQLSGVSVLNRMHSVHQCYGAVQFDLPIDCLLSSRDWILRRFSPNAVLCLPQPLSDLPQRLLLPHLLLRHGPSRSLSQPVPRWVVRTQWPVPRLQLHLQNLPQCLGLPQLQHLWSDPRLLLAILLVHRFLALQGGVLHRRLLWLASLFQLPVALSDLSQQQLLPDLPHGAVLRGRLQIDMPFWLLLRAVQPDRPQVPPLLSGLFQVFNDQHQLHLLRRESLPQELQLRV